MAFALNDEEQNKNQQQQNPSSLQAPPTTASAPGSGPGVSGGKVAQTPQSAPAQPFQNIQAYLGANQPQIQQQANTIAGNLTNQYGQIQSDINKGKSDFGTQVQSGYTQPNEQLANEAATNTAEFAKNPENVKAFQSLYNDQYTGPGNFESSGTYGDLSGKISKAQQDAALLGTNAGLQTYLQSQNPNATKGGNILDSVLLQMNPQANQQISQAAQPFGTLNDYLGTATTEANQGVTAAQQAAQKTARDLQNQFTGQGGLVPSFQQGLEQTLADTRTREAQEAANERQFLTGTYSSDTGGFGINVPGQAGQPIPQDVLNSYLTDLGLTQDQAKQLFTMRDTISQGYVPPSGINVVPGQDIDLSSYLTELPGAALSTPNVATQSDYDKAQAFAQLLNNPNLALAGSPIGGTNRSQYGYQAAIDKMQPIVDAIRAAYTKGGGYTGPAIPNAPISSTPNNPTPIDRSKLPGIMPIYTQPVVTQPLPAVNPGPGMPAPIQPAPVQPAPVQPVPVAPTTVPVPTNNKPLPPGFTVGF